jgi:hypothetical protein
MERATVWLPPAATVKGDAGEVVTPAGNPESATVTEPVNPFCAVVDTAKVELELPALAVIAEGIKAMLKSDAVEFIVRDKFAECVSALDFPVAVTL